MNPDSIPPKEKALLDLALEGKSDTFKVKVFEIVRRFKLDATDPSFLLLVSTGQLQALLEEFPAAFEALLLNLLARTQQEYRQMETSVKKEVTALKETAQGIQTTNAALAEDLAAAVENLKQFGKDQEQTIVEQGKEILEFARLRHTSLITDVKEREEEERKKRGEAYRAALSKSADRLIKESGAALKEKHAQELILTVVVGALIFAAMGAWAGFAIGQNRLKSDYAYKWATEHYRVNYQFIRECEKQRRKTCNVNTIAPGVVPGG